MRPGTIVICDYKTFSGETKRGLFMVVCDEEYDNQNNNVMNFTAIKITTKLDMIGTYTVNLSTEENPFFNSPCLASCSKIHTLHKHQIKHTLGRLSTNSFKKVYITIKKFLSEVDRQLMNEL